MSFDFFGSFAKLTILELKEDINFEPDKLVNNNGQSEYLARYFNLLIKAKLTQPQLQNFKTMHIRNHLPTMYKRIVFKIQCFCPQTNKWTLWNTPEYALKWFQVAVMSDSLIIVGGQPANNTVMSLNLITKTLTAFPSLTTERRRHSVVLMHGSLYVIGGHDGIQNLNSVERWDPVARSWSFIKPMQTSRSSAAVAVLNEHVYVVGGYNGKINLNSVEFYDPLAQLWKYAASMNVARWAHGVAVVNGHLYAVGGWGIDFSMERYDSRTNTWTMMSTTNTPNFSRDYRFSSTSTDNRIFVADGVNYVREYDTISGVWRELPQHADARHAVHLVTVPSSFASEHLN